MPGVRSTGERSGAVVIPQCVGGSPGSTESATLGASWALNRSPARGRSVVADGEHRLGFSRRLCLLKRDQAASVVHSRAASERLSRAAR